MHIYQEILTSLENEIKDLLRQAGYIPESLVLKVSCMPGGHWYFDVMAAVNGSSTRAALIRPGEAENAQQMLDKLRSKLTFVQTELTLV